MSCQATPLPCYRYALRFTRRSGRVPPGVARATVNALAAGMTEGVSYEQVVMDEGRIAETHDVLPAAREGA